MTEERTTRRSFLKTVGAATLSGLAASGVRGEGERGAEEATAAAAGAPRLNGNVDGILAAPEAFFRPTAAGCTVHWVPGGPVDAKVLAGPDLEQLAVVREVTSSESTAIAVQGFPPDSGFCVQCLFRRKGSSEWIARPVRRVHTARASGQTYRIALIADAHVYHAIRRDQDMRNLRQMIAHVVADRPDFAVFLGDEAGVYYLRDAPGSMSQEQAFARWELWRNAYAELLASVPSFMTLGNHEGEAGFYQAHLSGPSRAHYQRWGTIARKRYCLNPRPNTYPEGGEADGWSGSPGPVATGGAADGNRSPLENYYAWTWGDGLFVVLDVHRYTNAGGKRPDSVDQWTLGPSQMRWFERVLTSSKARWKFVVAHHLVGGYAWDLRGDDPKPEYVYGRGGARYARVGEQARITDIMKRAGARFFLYGHDHVFAHQESEGLHFVCCGRPTFLQPRWWLTPGWKEAYGDVAARNPNDFYAALGYTRLTVSPNHVQVEYVRTGTDWRNAENVSEPEGTVVCAFSVAVG